MLLNHVISNKIKSILLTIAATRSTFFHSTQGSNADHAPDKENKQPIARPDQIESTDRDQ